MKVCYILFIEIIKLNNLNLQLKMNKFVVYSGNGPQLIRNALLKRGHWEEVSFRS